MDPTQEELQRLLDILRKYAVFGQVSKQVSDPFTVTDLVKKAEEIESDEMGRARFKRQDLRDLMTFYGKVNGRSFGHLMMRHLDRINDGWCIKFEPSNSGRNAYRLVSL